MAQQLNLLDARFAPKPPRLSARTGLLAMAGLLALSLLGAVALRSLAASTAAEQRSLVAQAGPLKAQAAAPGASASADVAGSASAELSQLQALDASQRRIRAALEAGVAGAREGHADYLLALARQTSGALWITGFSVSDDGNDVELTGRMTDSAVLTEYLRRLNAEPRFKGRPFAQLNLRSADTNGAPLPYIEFALRSTYTAPP
jgi:Tfp pilus assembly protein PilN